MAIDAPMKTCTVALMMWFTAQPAMAMKEGVERYPAGDGSVPQMADVAASERSKDLPIVVTENESCRFVDKFGKYIIREIFEKAQPFDSQGMASVGAGRSHRYIDQFGKTVFKVKHGESFYFFGDIAQIRHDKKVGFIDRRGRIVVPIIWDEAQQFYEDAYIPVRQGKMWGYIDHQGEVKLQPQWKKLRSFNRHDLAPAQKGYLWGYINRAGQWIVKPAFSQANTFFNGKAIAKRDSVYGLLSTDGSFEPRRDQRFPAPSLILDIDGGKYLKAYVGNPIAGGKTGLLDRNLNWVVPPIYDSLYGNIGEPINSIRGLTVRVKGKYGFLGADGSLEISPRFEWAAAFKENRDFAVAKIGDMHGFIDRQGNWLVEPKFRTADICFPDIDRVIPVMVPANGE